MDSDSASTRSLLGLAGVASLCCLGTSTAALAGGTAGGLGLAAGFGQLAATGITLAVVGLVLRFATTCSPVRSCRDE
ncbi:hypothetical protein C483_08028 [Natrialba hulunbeirensis JCM 10989]|uniref:Uncharacterized protein n=1 Tax=Natrialba hulunbeirensis JCM 10989 TaxID=1227493 RepID=M0A3E2_9EURY|nr:hypothetical protein [Natrialba hulunbeirensis]ELY92387.1 hypothetical protein C483_08028 [Natrialba hulunbeirensis JCM 10989]